MFLGKVISQLHPRKFKYCVAELNNFFPLIQRFMAKSTSTVYLKFYLMLPMQQSKLDTQLYHKHVD